ncbi:MAG: DUF4432 family protein [Reyranellaceae bacterium]
MSADLREIVIDGTRALAFSTDGGLDFTVLIDRSLDIGPLSWRGQPVGWVGPAGFRHPAGHDPHADDGRGFDRLFSGFLVTGGLEHIRQPANGHPLHGTLPFTPATLTASGIDEGRDLLFCEGEVERPGFRLRRRIEAPIGGNSLSIHDDVENVSGEAQRQASLYHFNIGRPALADGTTVHHGPHRRLGPLAVPRVALGSASWPASDGGAQCRVTLPELLVDFAWDGTTLPHLQLWGDLSPGRGVLSVEPATSERVDGGLSGEEPLLPPGARRRYSLSVTFRRGHTSVPPP